MAKRGTALSRGTRAAQAWAGGLKGAYETWIELPSRHNSISYTIGPMSGGGGWDGKQFWTTDSSKQVRIEASDEAMAGAMQDAYRSANALFFPERAPATLLSTGLRKADGRTFDSIKVTPAGADPFEVWFDQTTHRIAREIQLTGDQPHTFIYGDYGAFGGIMTARTMTERVANDPKFDIVFHVASITLGGAENLSRYAPPAAPADDSTWPAGQDSITVPFQLINNHLYLRRRPSTAIRRFCSCSTPGATNVIQAGAAQSFGIKVEGALPGGGFGDKVAPFGVAKVPSVSISGFTLHDQIFSTMESPGWVKVEGIDSGGLLGYEFVKRAVLCVDYARRTMTFTKPAAFHPPTDVQAIPFTFDEHTPMVSGTP